jgi:hypothetical protein
MYVMVLHKLYIKNCCRFWLSSPPPSGRNWSIKSAPVTRRMEAWRRERRWRRCRLWGRRRRRWRRCRRWGWRRRRCGCRRRGRRRRRGQQHSRNGGASARYRRTIL